MSPNEAAEELEEVQSDLKKRDDAVSNMSINLLILVDCSP